MEETMQNNKISYEFAQEFSDSFADLNALYHAIDKLEGRIWGLVKWMRHSISDQQYMVMRLRYAPHEKGGRSTLEETGNQLGLTKQRVQQIEKQTLQKLWI